MLVCEVLGTVVATRKVLSFGGYKLLVVSPVNTKGKTATVRNEFVAIDMVGAGLGEQVLVTQGSNARLALDQDLVPVDAVVVGIIDSLEVPSVK